MKFEKPLKRYGGIRSTECCLVDVLVWVTSRKSSTYISDIVSRANPLYSMTYLPGPSPTMVSAVE